MKVLLLIVAMLLIVVPAMAGNYLQNFESYAPGQLNSNSAWSSASSYWSVVANSSLNGTQAITNSSQIDLVCPIFPHGITFADGTVASTNVQTNNNGWFFWNVANNVNPGFGGAYVSTPYAGILWDPNDVNGLGSGLFVSQGGYGWTQVTGEPAMNNGDDYLLRATLNFTNQTIAYSVSDITNPADSFGLNAAFGYTTTTTMAANGDFYVGGGTGTEFDNMAITTPVPEPSALLALATGLMGICGFSIRRRK